jgi:hypothetical protein
MSVIAGGRVESCEPNAFVAGSRAGDRLEPWALPATSVVARLAERAAAAGLDPDLAVRLCVEVALAQVTLRQVGVDPQTVDRLAEAPRFQRRLDDRDAAYARRLTHAAGDPQPGPTRSLATVGLPLRLTAQLHDVDLTDLLRDADPVQARSWELTALAEGRTISEWALLAALRAQNA